MVEFFSLWCISHIWIREPDSLTDYTLRCGNLPVESAEVMIARLPSSRLVRTTNKSFVSILQRMRQDGCPSLRYHWRWLQRNWIWNAVRTSKSSSPIISVVPAEWLADSAFREILKKPQYLEDKSRHSCIISYAVEKAWNSFVEGLWLSPILLIHILDADLQNCNEFVL